MFITEKIKHVKQMKKLLNQITNLHLEEQNGHLVNINSKKEPIRGENLQGITATELIATIQTLEHSIYSLHHSDPKQAESLLFAYRYYIQLLVDKVDQLLEQTLEIFERTQNKKVKGVVGQISSLDLINIEIELETCLSSGHLLPNTCQCIKKTIEELDDILYAEVITENKEGISYEKTRLSI